MNGHPGEDHSPRDQDVTRGGTGERGFEEGWTASMRELTALWVRVQPIVSAYFTSSVMDGQHVEDLVQEVAEAVVENFGQFDRGRSFTAWVLGIARNRLLKYYRTRTRDRLVLSEAALEQLAVSMEQVESEAEPRREALRECLREISGRRREVVDMRYSAGAAIDEIGGKYGMTTSAVSVMLHRVRAALQECIRRRLAAGN